jgi:hypothetical protein
MDAEVLDDSIDRGGLGVGRAVVRGEREVDQPEAIPHRTVNRIDVVDEFKAAQGGGAHARSGAVSGVDQGVIGDSVDYERVEPTAMQRFSEHERIAAGGPDQVPWERFEASAEESA